MRPHRRAACAWRRSRRGRAGSRPRARRCSPPTRRPPWASGPSSASACCAAADPPRPWDYLLALSGSCQCGAIRLEVQSTDPARRTDAMSALPATMTAIEISAPGGPEGLRPASRPMPMPAAGAVLIQVAAAGVNRPDVMQRQGSYPPPAGASDIPGLEIAGKVVAVGLGVNHTKIGDSVCALVTGGGYATYCAAPELQCLPIPKRFSMVEAAALPETFFTVWHNVFERGALKPGESILIH